MKIKTLRKQMTSKRQIPRRINILKVGVEQGAICALIVCLLLVGEAGAECNGNLKIYTVCQRKVCLTSEHDNLQRWLPSDASGCFEADTNILFEVYDALASHLAENLDMSKFKLPEYELDNITFSFYEYYLQMIPFRAGDKKMMYINAYRRDRRSDETPAKTLIVTLGGGSNYWNILYDMEERKFIDLRINGNS